MSDPKTHSTHAFPSLEKRLACNVALVIVGLIVVFAGQALGLRLQYVQNVRAWCESTGKCLSHPEFVGGATFNVKQSRDVDAFRHSFPAAPIPWSSLAQFSELDPLPQGGVVPVAPQPRKAKK
ncbi:hypothetical protein [Polaromonas sp. JS666]|uniref:hypothetical protein n=1 Tax=Polaromonas sp. (strain JS666 / ATCC BAA-500) TaxID=296591 RepID=UPI0012EEE0E0|nr:hypothetical protein [Polaromonas sp. JS666]